jgi:Deoxyribonuclease II
MPHFGVTSFSLWLVSSCISVTSAAVVEASHTNCRDAAGAPVDWWAALKMPNGAAFAYIDASIISASGDAGRQPGANRSHARPPAWLFGTHLGGKSSPLGRTLVPLYRVSGRAGHVLYNDELPSGVEEEYRAHAKGVIGFEKNGGFWLQHSVPRYEAPCAVWAAVTETNRMRLVLLECRMDIRSLFGRHEQDPRV